MRLLHTSDTHLGHQQYSRLDPRTGLNQREQDHYDSWSAIIDAAIADPPDCFIHAGDLFDGVRPSNRALAAALEGFLRLSRAGISAVVIAGNHEHPKMRETGSPLRLLEHLDGVHAIYKGRAESIEVVPGLHIHGVPQCPDQASLREQVQGIELGDGDNVLVIHGSVHDIPAFRHAEFNEQSLEPAWFDRFDYTALGHYHGMTEVSKTAWYCGAPDRVSISESGQQKGYLDVPIGHEPTFRPLPTRPYTRLPEIDAAELDATAIQAAAEEALAKVDAGTVARLTLENVSPGLRGALDQRAIRQAGSHLLHLDLRIEWSDRSQNVRGGVELGGLLDEFEEFAAHQKLGKQREALMERARAVLREVL